MVQYAIQNTKGDEIITDIFLNLNNIIGIILKIISFLLLYKIAYKIIGLFITRKFEKTDKRFNYGVVIAARNEEAVIGNLIDSIKKQDYESEKIKIFVVADNCTDNTASIARSLGAVCYERTDEANKTNKNYNRRNGKEDFSFFYNVKHILIPSSYALTAFLFLMPKPTT